MERRIAREDARSLLARTGLSVSDERLDRLAPAIETARAAGLALAAFEMGYSGPPPFRPPGPDRGQEAHED